jgi:hypothetical protein
MIPPLFSYQLLVLGLLWLFVRLSLAWPSPSGPQVLRPTIPRPSRRTRGKEPQPFGGLTRKPLCILCDQEATPPTPPPPVRPEPLPPTHRRPRAIDTARHFGPHTDCDYRGWLGLGTLRANGHPSGGQWRQCPCTACKGDFPEPHGTRFHGKRVSVARIVPVIGCLAEGLGIRGTARGFAIDPNTVRSWLMAAAAQLRACSQSCWHDLPLRQGQLDALSAVLSALKAGEVSEEERIEWIGKWIGNSNGIFARCLWERTLGTPPPTWTPHRLCVPLFPPRPC